MSKHVMVDLETLGSRPGCAILSIGAVEFNHLTGKLGEEFYCVVNRKSCAVAGLVEDADTLAWWGRQNAQAQAVIKEAGEAADTIADALTRFTAYLSKYGLAQVRVWGNGSDFDNAILAVAFDKAGLKFPWKFWNNRCFRTLKSLNPDVPMPRGGVYHNALDDAKTQANAAIQMMREAQSKVAGSPVRTT